MTKNRNVFFTDLKLCRVSTRFFLSFKLQIKASKQTKTNKKKEQQQKRT